MGGTSFLRVPTLRATGTRTGAVLNDSPVGCQSRDLAPPAGGVESPQNKYKRQQWKEVLPDGRYLFFTCTNPKGYGGLKR